MGTSCSKHETQPTPAAFPAEPAPTDVRRMDQQQRTRWSSSALLGYELNGGVPKSPLSAGYPKQPDAFGGSSSRASREATLDAQGIPQASASGSSLRGSRCRNARNPLVRQHQTDHGRQHQGYLRTASAVGCSADAKEMAEARAMLVRIVLALPVDDCPPPLCDTTAEPRDGPLDWSHAVPTIQADATVWPLRLL